MRESDFPSVEDIAAQLDAQTSWWHPSQEDLDSDDGAFLDVRLQVEESGIWHIHTGDTCYDTSHVGFWGAASLPVEAKNDTASLRKYREIAEELRIEAIEDAWDSDAMEEEEAE